MPVGLYAGANVSNGNGVTVAFPYNFKILDQTHIEVKVDGVLKVLGADYTVSGVGNSNGGNVTFGVAPANGAVVQRARKVPYKRDQDYQYNGDLREEVVDPDLDTIEMQVQQIAADAARAFKAPLSVTADQVISDADWAAAAGKFLRRKNDGSGIEFVAASPSDNTFTQTGVGMVARSWSSKVAEIVSVTDAGAVAGGTDNTATFTKLKDAMVARGGGALFFPKGSWYGSIALAATDDGIALVGEDWNGTMIEAKDNATTAIEIASGCHNVTIENLSVKNTGGTNNGTHYGIRSKGDGAGNGASYLHLRRVKVDGYNINIKLDEFNGHNLESVWSTNAVHGGFAAPNGANIYAGHVTTHCVGLWMHDCHVSGGKYGYYLETAEGAALSNCEALLNTENSFAHITGTGGVTGMQMTNCQFDSAGNGAVLLQKVFNAHFANVWASSGASAAGAGSFGVKLDACDNNTFTNVQAYSCTGDGVWISNGSQKNNFLGLQAVSNGGDGVQIDNGCWGNSFSVPTCWNNGAKAFNFADTTADEPNIVVGPYDRGNGVASTFQSKDVIIGGTYNAGREMTYAFFKTNAGDGLNAADLGAMPNTDVNVYVAPRAGSLTSISIALNDTRVAGTLSVRPKVNGVVKDALRVQIDNVNTQYMQLEVTPGTIPIVAGDRIGVYYDTDAGWDTTGAAGTVDFNVVVGLTTR